MASTNPVIHTINMFGFVCLQLLNLIIIRLINAIDYRQKKVYSVTSLTYITSIIVIYYVVYDKPESNDTHYIPKSKRNNGINVLISRTRNILNQTWSYIHEHAESMNIPNKTKNLTATKTNT